MSLQRVIINPISKQIDNKNICSEFHVKEKTRKFCSVDDYKFQLLAFVTKIIRANFIFVYQYYYCYYYFLTVFYILK